MKWPGNKAQRAQRAENLARVLDISRATLDAEFLRANRWDEKARGEATLAGAWFAVTQAVAAVAAGTNASEGWVIGLAAGLVLQAATLAMNLVRVAGVWRPRDRNEFGRETLEALEGRMDDPPDELTAALIDFYKTVLDESQKANEDRGKKFDKATFWWWFVLAIGIAEIGAALLSRVA